MLDRPGEDIDALLISALYGELSPADEARLNAHLDSHPGDKSALADLTSARNAVRESRFLTVQIEPPQAVSALLLQEASRSAPARAVAKEPPKESWFQRFVTSFVRHPAMAAAAMLVVVVGVAGTMYLRNGDAQFVEQRTSSRGEQSASPTGAPAVAASTDTSVEEAKALEDRAGSAFNATLAEPRPEPMPEGAADKPQDPKVAAAKPELSRDVAKKPAQEPKAANRTYFGVQTERAPQPKELGPSSTAPADLGGADDQIARRGKGGYATGNTRPSPAPSGVADSRDEKEKQEPVVATPAPPPPPRAQTTTRPGAGGAGGEDKLKDRTGENEETSWAREQHAKVTNAVKANNCKDATVLAVQLSNRAPAYYTQNVENDRELKRCMTYINAEREKEADKQQRARALQKRNADEANPRRAAPPTTNSK